jgi:hypothetical protein
MEYSEFYEVLKHKINDSSIFESVKKNIIENNRINEIKKNEEEDDDDDDDEDEDEDEEEEDEDKPKRKHKRKKGDEDEEDELAKIETEKGESNMKLMKKRSKKK